MYRTLAMSSPCRARGLTLIEVLVTVVVLAIGLLGLAALQLNSLRNNVTAYERSVATLLAYEIIDRMRANAASAESYAVGFDEPPVGGVNCVASFCNAVAMAKYDLDAWKCSLGAWVDEEPCAAVDPVGTLLDGQGEITVDGRQVTVTIRWQENRTAGTTTSLSVVTELGG